MPQFLPLPLLLILPHNPYLLPAPLGWGTQNKLTQLLLSSPTSNSTHYSNNPSQIPSQK